MRCIFFFPLKFASLSRHYACKKPLGFSWWCLKKFICWTTNKQTVYSVQSLIAHSCSLRRRSFWSALRIATSGRTWFSEYEQSIRFVFDSYSHPIRFIRFDGKSVNRGLPVLDRPRCCDCWYLPRGARPLGTRMFLLGFVAPCFC